MPEVDHIFRIQYAAWLAIRCCSSSSLYTLIFLPRRHVGSSNRFVLFDPTIEKPSLILDFLNAEILPNNQDTLKHPLVMSSSVLYHPISRPHEA